jgi:hypothetical protein
VPNSIAPLRKGGKKPRYEIGMNAQLVQDQLFTIPASPSQDIIFRNRLLLLRKPLRLFGRPGDFLGCFEALSVGQGPGRSLGCESGPTCWSEGTTVTSGCRLLVTVLEEMMSTFDL